jgi:hypothetical protein
MRVISSIFLVIFLINTGYYGIYQIMILRSKWKASVIINNADHPERMKILTLSNKEADAFDQDELLYKGMLFDVAKRTKVRDSVVVYLYPDNEEQTVLTQLVNYFKSDNRNLIPAGEKIFQIKSPEGFQDLISCDVNRNPIPDKWLIPCISYLQYSPKVLNRFLRVPTPPPEYLF